MDKGEFCGESRALNTVGVIVSEDGAVIEQLSACGECGGKPAPVEALRYVAERHGFGPRARMGWRVPGSIRVDDVGEVGPEGGTRGKQKKGGGPAGRRHADGAGVGLRHYRP